MKRMMFSKKFVSTGFLLIVVMFLSGCVAATTATNASFITTVNIEVSDLILGQPITVEGNFTNDAIQSGYAMQILTAKALQGKDYDFIFLPRLERTGSKVTLIGRPAKLKN